MGRLALRDHRRRPPRPRVAARGRARARPRGRFLGLRMRWVVNMGAFLSQPGPLINTRNPATHAINVYRIPALYGRHLLVLTNTTSDHRLPRRRPAECLLPRRAAGRRGRARARHRPRRDPPAQPHPERGLPLQDADRLDLRQRRSGGRARRGSPALGLGDVRRTKKRSRGGKLRGIGCAVFCEPSGAGARRRKRR